MVAVMAAILLLVQSCVGSYRGEVNVRATGFENQAEMEGYIGALMFGITGYEWTRYTYERPPVFDGPKQLGLLRGLSGRRSHRITIWYYDDYSVQMWFGWEGVDGVAEEGAWLYAFAASVAPDHVELYDILAGANVSRPVATPPRPEWPACQVLPTRERC